MHVVDNHDEISAGDGRGKREEGSEEEDQMPKHNTKALSSP